MEAGKSEAAVKLYPHTNVRRAEPSDGCGHEAGLTREGSPPVLRRPITFGASSIKAGPQDEHTSIDKRRGTHITSRRPALTPDVRTAPCPTPPDRVSPNPSGGCDGPFPHLGRRDYVRGSTSWPSHQGGDASGERRVFDRITTIEVGHLLVHPDATRMPTPTYTSARSPRHTYTQVHTGRYQCLHTYRHRNAWLTDESRLTSLRVTKGLHLRRMDRRDASMLRYYTFMAVGSDLCASGDRS